MGHSNGNIGISVTRQLSIMAVFIEIEAILNFETKLDITGGTGLVMFLGIFFCFFRQSFKKQWVISDDFVMKVGGFGSFRVVLVCFGPFRGFSCFNMYLNKVCSSRLNQEILFVSQFVSKFSGKFFKHFRRYKENCERIVKLNPFLFKLPF